MSKKQGWHGERKRHSDAAKKGHRNKKKKMNPKRIDYLIKDESKASKEYAELYKENKTEISGVDFKELSEDEKKHEKFLRSLKKRSE